MPHPNHDTADRADHQARLIELIRSMGGYVPDPPSGDASELEIAFLECVVAGATSPVTTPCESLAHGGGKFPQRD